MRLWARKRDDFNTSTDNADTWYSASGSYTITATSNGVSVSATATVEDSQPAFSIRVVTSPGSGEPGDTLTFAVEVQQDGTLTQGLTVTFSVSPNNGTATLSPTSTTTDSNGQAQTTLTLGSSASGSYTITATSNGASVSATAQLKRRMITTETEMVTVVRTMAETIRNRTYRKETNLNPTKTVVLCFNYLSTLGGTSFISPLRLRR